MGLMARALTLRDAAVKTLPESRGPAVVMSGDAGVHAETREVWGPPGLWSMPPDGTEGIRVPVGGSDRFGVIMATHHYKTPRPTLAKGETAIGSTSADGATLKASARFYADGKVALGNSTKDLLTLLNGLIDQIKAIVTVGSATTQTVNPASQAALEAYKAQLSALLKVPV